MPVLDPKYIQSMPLQQVIFDNLGNALSNGQIFYYKDSARTVLKPVYELSGVVGNEYTYAELPNPLVLSAIGSFVDDSGNNLPGVYYYPYDEDGELELYYIVVQNEDGVEQFTVQAQPNIIVDSTPGTLVANSDNILANPQFAQVSFNGNAALTISVTTTGQETQIAPDWSIIASGTSGTLTVTLVKPTAINIPTQPPYLLDIAQASLTGSVILKQRLTASPRIYAGDFLSATLTARSMDNQEHLITMVYTPSSGTPVTLISENLPSSGYSTLKNTVALDGTINTDAAPSGYVDILISIPNGAHIQISSLQIAGVDNINSEVSFIQQSTARQIDHLFHYYYDSIIMQPKSSILVGWNFPVNPWQFTPFTGGNSTGIEYTADQTILVSQNYILTGSTGHISYKVASGVNGMGYQVSALDNTSQFGIMQYIPTVTCMPYFNYKMSALVNLRLITVVSSSIRIKMRLFYRASQPSPISQTEPIAAWGNGADPTPAAGWTAVAPLNDPAYTISTTSANYSFNSFQLPAPSSQNMVIICMVYTIDNMHAGHPDSIIFNNISLVRNDFAIGSNPLTYDETYKQCQFFYEKSTEPGVSVWTGSNADVGIQQLMMPAQSFNNPSPSVTAYVDMYPGAFEIKYTVPKVTVSPVVNIYAPSTGTEGDVDCTLTYLNGGVTFTTATASVTMSDFWNAASISSQSVTFTQKNGTAIISNNGATQNTDSPCGYISYHYEVDGRMGLY